MDEKNLSHRLLVVASFVPQNALLADIGSDHAYLPAYLALHHQIDFAICGEVVKGPYENAKHVIARSGLAEKIETRLADGLAAIKKNDQVDCVTICGMGGTLIAAILAAGEALITATHPRLILQPNVGENNVRSWLDTHGYEIIAERILNEDKHTYEIIVADFTAKKPTLTAEQITFGPLLMAEKNMVFIYKWQHERQKLQKVKLAMHKATTPPLEKITEINAQITQISQVLGDEADE